MEGLEMQKNESCKKCVKQAVVQVMNVARIRTLAEQSAARVKNGFNLLLLNPTHA